MSRKKILIVDDNEVVQRALTMLLSVNQYDVITAGEGAEAVRMARKENPDLILLDISFPPDVAHGGSPFDNGLKILQWLRRMEETAGIPILVMTIGDAAKYRELALKSGANEFLRKPVGDHELLSAISRHLQSKPAPATVAN